MEDLGKIIGNNLIFLRKKAGLTQLDFGEKFNYSDKTVSRWETGEITPSVETLKAIADFYEVSVDFLLKEHAKENGVVKIIKSTPNYRNKVLMVALLITIVFTVAMTVYLAGIYNLKTADPNLNRFWVSFLWAIPISCIVLCYFARKIFHSKINLLIFESLFVWTTLASAYVTALVLNNYWYLFFIGIPLQVALILLYKMRN